MVSKLNKYTVAYPNDTQLKKIFDPMPKPQSSNMNQQYLSLQIPTTTSAASSQASLLMVKHHQIPWHRNPSSATACSSLTSMMTSSRM
jgi:hypothetical protein